MSHETLCINYASNYVLLLLIFQVRKSLKATYCKSCKKYVIKLFSYKKKGKYVDLPPNDRRYPPGTSVFSYALQHVIVDARRDEQVRRIGGTEFVIFIYFGYSPRMSLKLQTAHLKFTRSFYD